MKRSPFIVKNCKRREKTHYVVRISSHKNRTHILISYREVYLNEKKAVNDFEREFSFFKRINGTDVLFRIETTARGARNPVPFHFHNFYPRLHPLPCLFRTSFPSVGLSVKLVLVANSKSGGIDVSQDTVRFSLR
jgi:hypothetical protein